MCWCIFKYGIQEKSYKLKVLLGSPIFGFKSDQTFLLNHSTLWQNMSDFVSLDLKLHNPYYHVYNDQQEDRFDVGKNH